MPDYNRALIADMLDSYHSHMLCDLDLEHLESSIREQAELLRAADEADAAGVHTSKRCTVCGDREAPCPLCENRHPSPEHAA